MLVFGILIGVAALFLRLNTIAFGEPRGPTAEAQASYVPMFAHLALVFVAGIYMPPALVAWFQNVAKLLDRPMVRLIDRSKASEADAIVRGRGCGERGQLALRRQPALRGLLDAARALGRRGGRAHGRAR